MLIVSLVFSAGAGGAVATGVGMPAVLVVLGMGAATPGVAIPSEGAALVVLTVLVVPLAFIVWSASFPSDASRNSFTPFPSEPST